MDLSEAAAWDTNWAWSLPLIVLTVVIHVFGLALIDQRVVRVLSGIVGRRRFIPLFAVVVGAAALLATGLHAGEAAVWAAAYRLLGAMPDTKSAMLYSVGAMTTYGHAPVYLNPHWEMMGALEALNGMLLFGLTTAFLFSMIQKVLPEHRRGPR
jgi:hypothetical protein